MATEEFKVVDGKLVNKDIMSAILSGLHEEHKPIEGGDGFVCAIYALYDKYCEDAFDREWARLDENTKIYNGKHWETFGDDNPENKDLPRPSIPTLTSAIENLKADYNDEFPEAVIIKESVHSEEAAKVLTTVVRQELDMCGFESEYGDIVHDILQDGWGVWEIGYDPWANQGMGGSFIRTCMNKNFMCDPEVKDLQDGRACFKIDSKPRYWFKQHYPELFPLMVSDKKKDDHHENKTDATPPSTDDTYMLLECWVREFDPKSKRHRIHFAKVAGHQLLELSTKDYPGGYYAHGLYPFVVTSLYKQRGTELGIGLVDIFRDAQRYSDKAVQIVLSNLLHAAKPRIIVDKSYLENPDDVLDFRKNVIYTNGPVAQAYTWQQAQPLPNTAFGSIDYLTSTIKNESGTNDQSRGQTGAGVTAASAITALQEMSTKRSRMGCQRLQHSFRKAVVMLLDVLREKHLVPRDIEITVNGEPHTVSFDADWFDEQLTSNDGNRIVPFVSVKSARKTRFSMMAHNELILQVMQMTNGSTDPVIMLEAFQGDEMENVLDTIRRAQNAGMLNLQKTVAEQAQMLQQLSAELQKSKQALAGAEANIKQLASQQARSAESALEQQRQGVANMQLPQQ